MPSRFESCVNISSGFTGYCRWAFYKMNFPDRKNKKEIKSFNGGECCLSGCRAFESWLQVNLLGYHVTRTRCNHAATFLVLDILVILPFCPFKLEDRLFVFL